MTATSIKTVASRAHTHTKSANFPVKFPDNGNFRAETGSLLTRSSAI
jgi:hypothetical protein